ncbi:MAG: hypothetical protein ACKVJN_02485, partial [Woeseiales bacterium]
MTKRPLKLVIIALATCAGGTVGADTFQSTDLFEIEIAGDPQISPDGSTVAYARLTSDIMTDRTRSNIW